MIKLPPIAKIRQSDSLLLFNTFPNDGCVDIFSGDTKIYSAYVPANGVIEVWNTELLQYLENGYTMKLTDIQTKEVKTYKIE